MNDRFYESCLAIVRQKRLNRADAEWYLNYWDGRYKAAVIEGEMVHGSGSIENARMWRKAYQTYLEELQ